MAEAIIEAVIDNRKKLRVESTDLLCQLIVVPADAGLKIDDVAECLIKRYQMWYCPLFDHFISPEDCIKSIKEACL